MTAQEAIRPVLELWVVLAPEHPASRQDHMAVLAGRLGLVGVVAPAGTGADRLVALARLTAPTRVIAADTNEIPVLVGCDLGAIAEARAAHPGSIAVQLTVAIGRTMNEAAARAERDPRFHGAAHPRESGLYGTFEQAQAQVLELARAGVSQLWVSLADELDIADLMAQVRALVVGATPTLLARD